MVEERQLLELFDASCKFPGNVLERLRERQVWNTVDKNVPTAAHLSIAQLLVLAKIHPHSLLDMPYFVERGVWAVNPTVGGFWKTEYYRWKDWTHKWGD